MAVLQEGNTLYEAERSHRIGQTGVNYAIEEGNQHVGNERRGRSRRKEDWVRSTSATAEEERHRERGLQGVAALVGTRLGVGSFVSWTLLLARINLLPPPLPPSTPSPPPTTVLPVPRSSPPKNEKGAPGHPWS